MFLKLCYETVLNEQYPTVCWRIIICYIAPNNLIRFERQVLYLAGGDKSLKMMHPNSAEWTSHHDAGNDGISASSITHHLHTENPSITPQTAVSKQNSFIENPEENATVPVFYLPRPPSPTFQPPARHSVIAIEPSPSVSRETDLHNGSSVPSTKLLGVPFNVVCLVKVMCVLFFIGVATFILVFVLRLTRTVSNG